MLHVYKCYWPVTGQSRVRFAPTGVLILPPTTTFRLALCKSDIFFHKAIIAGCSVRIKENISNNPENMACVNVYSAWTYMTHQPTAPALFPNQILYRYLLCTCRFQHLWCQDLRCAALQHYPTKPHRGEKRHHISRKIRLGRLSYSVWFPHPHMPH